MSCYAITYPGLPSSYWGHFDPDAESFNSKAHNKRTQWDRDDISVLKQADDLSLLNPLYEDLI